MKSAQRTQSRKLQSTKRFFFRARPNKKSITGAVSPLIGKESSEETTRFKYDHRNDKGQFVIRVGIERGNRMAVYWPSALSALTEQLHVSTSNLGRLIGPLSNAGKSGKKKLAPLNYYNAKKLIVILRGFHKLKTAKGGRVYDVILDEDFDKWYSEEHEAGKLCDKAIKLLNYDDTIQTEFDFLRKPLYPWQSAGMRVLNAITVHGKGALVCDETGLGKTYTVTAHIASEALQAVVVCPANLTESWYRKVQDISNLSVIKVESKYPLNLHTYDIIIVSYSMLKKFGHWPLSDIIDGQQRVLVLDEGHFAKDYRSKRTKLSLDLGVYAKHTIVITATPLKNREKELHPLLRVTRRLWTEEAMDDFDNYYATSDGRAEIAERLSKFMIRRMFKSVKPDFPKGEVGEAWVELSNRDDYKRAEKNFIRWLVENGACQDKLDSAARCKALVRMNKLRQLSADGKLQSAMSIMEKTMDVGEQVIVFCAFRDPLYQIASHFANKTGTNFKGQTWKGSAIIASGVSKKKRYQAIDGFMAGDIGILCIGVGAGGLGIDLPIARFAYFLDLPWSPADFEQCTGRLLRLGQTRDCQFIKLLALNTIDQRMEEIMNKKAKIFAETIGDTDVYNRITAKDSSDLQVSIVSAIISSYLKDAISANLDTATT